MSKAPALSRNESLVLAALRREPAPQSAYQLLDRLRGEGLRAPLQIYRALRSLSERRLVHRLDSLNAFVACAHEHAHRGRTVIFSICEACGRVAESADAGIDERLGALALEEGFRASVAAVEMRGRCCACGPQEPRPDVPG